MRNFCLLLRVFFVVLLSEQYLVAAEREIPTLTTKTHAPFLRISKSLRGGSTPSSFQQFRRPAKLFSPLGKTPNSYQQQQQNSVQQDRDDAQRDAKEAIESFLTVDSRRTFIARVYGILAIQLAVTLASILFFTEVIPVQFWLNNLWATATIPLVSMLVSTVTWVITCTNIELRRKRPFLLVSIFTIAEALCMGFISTLYPRGVWPAVMATAVSVGAVSTYTIATRNRGADISQWGSTISSCGLVMCSYGLLYILGVPLPMKDAVYGMAGAALFAMYLAYHTRTIVSVSLYNDIINMFLYILRIIGEDRHD